MQGPSKNTGPGGDRRDAAILGVLLGTAVGDALGLPREGLSPTRAARLFGDVLQHRLIAGRGLLSDDTEHSCMLAQALLRSRGDLSRFTRSFAWRLRFWLLGLPAGVGLGTARAILKLWLGFPPSRSGVGSAGNGPAMRSALLGVFLRGDTTPLVAWVRAATRVTHTDPRAFSAALLVALAARRGAEAAPGGVDPVEFVREARAVLGNDLDGDLDARLTALVEHTARGSSVREFAAALGLGHGVTGYAYDTVPVALFGWLRHPADFRAAVTEVVACGGDADTTGAIVGAIAGATLGEAGIPEEWLAGLADWPRSCAWLRRLSQALASPADGRPVPLFWPALPLRNLAFLSIVLSHGIRRLFPPY